MLVNFDFVNTAKVAAAGSKPGPPGAPKAWCLDANCTALNWQRVPTRTFLHFSLKAKSKPKDEAEKKDCRGGFFGLIGHCKSGFNFIAQLPLQEWLSVNVKLSLQEWLSS